MTLELSWASALVGIGVLTASLLALKGPSGGRIRRLRRALRTRPPAKAAEHLSQSAWLRGRPAAGKQPDPLRFAQFIDQFATVLRSGVAPPLAWQAVLAADPDLPPPLRRVAQLGANGGDVHGALLTLRLGSAGSALAASLAVSERTGAPLAKILDTLAAGLRDSSDADLARAAAFAGPRSTARILAALPLVALGLGTAMGADPLRVLFQTPVGIACAIAGSALTVIGWAWSRKLVGLARGRNVASVPRPAALGKSRHRFAERGSGQ